MLVVLIVLVLLMVVVPSFDSFRCRYLSSNRHMRKLFEVPNNVEVTSASGDDISKSQPSVTGEVDPILTLASKYDDQGNYIVAESLYKQYIDKVKVEIGESHPDTLAAMNSLALCYHNQV